MNPNESWVIFEAEASGMKRPQYVVEIAAQRMRGWEPEGTRFRVLLNQGVPIESQGTSIHGYTEEYLRQHGQDPRLAHSLFRDYVNSARLVNHNLPMAWDRLLLPEFERVGISPPGIRGFSTLNLARRVLPEASTFALSALSKRYKLVDGDMKGAVPDVEAMVALCKNWFGPRLAAAGIVGFEAVAEFSTRVTPAKCRQLIEEAVKDKALPVPQSLKADAPSPEQTLAEFQQIVRDIMADGVMTTAEFLVLMDWLRDCPFTEIYPINRLQEAIQEVSARDGLVTAEDQAKLEKALKFYLETGKAPPKP